MNSLKFCNLTQLFGAYFHQDWSEEFETWECALNAFLQSEPKESKEYVYRELNTLIEKCVDEKKLEEILGSFGSYYEPLPDSLSFLEWITLIVKTIEKDLDN